MTQTTPDTIEREEDAPTWPPAAEEISPMPPNPRPAAERLRVVAPPPEAPQDDDLSLGGALRMLVREFSASNERIGAEIRANNEAHRQGLERLATTFATEARADRQEIHAGFAAISEDLRGIKDSAPGRGTLWAGGGLLTVTLVALLGLLAMKGVDVEKVAEAVQTVQGPLPAAPVAP